MFNKETIKCPCQEWITHTEDKIIKNSPKELKKYKVVHSCLDLTVYQQGLVRYYYFKKGQK